MKIKAISYPRAALIGNPSDGYFGKTIAFVFSDFSVTISLVESKQIIILPSERDQLSFDGLENLHNDIENYGYYGGIRLLKASLKRFYEHCKINGYSLDAPNFTVSYSSNIPNRLGLAGSSAIITACMKALMGWYNVDIKPAHLANLVLSVEKEELSIGAGLQDRVAQAFAEPVFMDFDEDWMKKKGFGKYDTIDLQSIEKQLFIAYRTSSSEGSEVVHNDLRQRFEKGNSDVVSAMEKWGQLTLDFKRALTNNDLQKINTLINENFDLRDELIGISSAKKEMVKIARSHGASAKFTGSGGAIIGLVDDASYAQLAEALKAKQIEIFRPEIVKTEPKP